MAECQHEKVYASYAVFDTPPSYPWVCRKCGAEGLDRGMCVPLTSGKVKRTVKGDA